MKRAAAIVAAAAFALLAFGGTEAAGETDPCLSCHEKETPGIVKYWKDSKHFSAEISCAECHGTDKENSHSGSARVEAARCGACHETAFGSHRLGKHGFALKAGRGCTRNMPGASREQQNCSFCHERDSAAPLVPAECAMFLAQSVEMQRQGCESCHLVEPRCDTCHTKHGTDLTLAGSPETCGVCHMGPDHAQLEMWGTSVHGAIWKARGPGDAPSCTTCHMQEGTHNVSQGIAYGMTNSGLREKERERMLDACAKCHTRALARRNLEDADRIEEQSRALVDEARKIVESLNSEGLLEPAPATRPDHPLFGAATFTTGPQMLYEDISTVESILFRMKLFHYMSAFKGAYHQNPDYTHWFGNAPLKLSLSEIKSRAALLRKIDKIQRRLDNMGSIIEEDAPDKSGPDEDIKHELRRLKEQRLTGDISEDEYRRLKKEALDRSGL